MRRSLTLAAALAVASVFIPQALAADPTPVPFPAPTVVQVFVAAETVTPTGVLASWYAPGSTVVFRAYAVDQKTHKVITASDMRYFYVTIPNQPNVKLKYNPTAPGATAIAPWVGTWTVPANYPAGIVDFKVLIQTTQKMKGQFVQMPVATSQLTISATPPPTAAAGPAAAATALPASLDVSLYVDSVNGTRPAGAARGRVPLTLSTYRDTSRLDGNAVEAAVGPGASTGGAVAEMVSCDGATGICTYWPFIFWVVWIRTLKSTIPAG